MLRQQIILDLKKALKYAGVAVVEPKLEHPADEKNGDYSSNIAMVAFKKKPIAEYKSPLFLAQTIVDNFLPAPYLEKVEAVAPGFINFWLKPGYIYNSLDVCGKNDLMAGKKIMVEFAHPNTHKMFHIGHLRNITTGESVVRILEANGVEVVRANYQGDVGMHIAKCLYGISFKGRGPSKLAKLKSLDEKIKFLGEAYVAGAKAYEENEAAKKEIAEINKKIYAGEMGELYQATRKWSLEYFEKIYKRVDTHFDRYYFESEVVASGKKIVSEGLKKGIFEKSEGAIIFPGEKFGLHARVFVTSEGNLTYEGKDLGLAPLQFKEFKPDLIIHCVGPEQAGYFKVMFEALAQLFPETRGREYHLIYGWVRLKKGKMSSRTGQVVLGEWLIDEAKQRLQGKFKMNDETAEIVAVGAVKYSLLKVGLSGDIAFDIDESINLEGDSGPYLQYTYARTRSVLAKAKDLRLDTGNWKLDEEVRSSKLDNQASSLQPQNLVSSVQRLASEELSLLRSLYRFSEIVASAGIQYSPNLLCGYLFDLSQKYNLFYNRLSILNPQPQEARPLEATREIRLKLTEATGRVLKNGLYLLGIKVVDKM